MEDKKFASGDMPELKAGMIVSGKFLNNNGDKQEYGGILLECDTSLFAIYADADRRLKYISDIKHDEIDRIYKMKRPSIFTEILSDDNLLLIWERKPAINWSKVAVDTKVLVKYTEESPWIKRYFAKYEDGKVYVFEDGCDSFTAGNGDQWFSAPKEVAFYRGNEKFVNQETLHD